MDGSLGGSAHHGLTTRQKAMLQAASLRQATTPRYSSQRSARCPASVSGDGDPPNPRPGPYVKNAGRNLDKCKRNAKRPPRQRQQPPQGAFGAADDGLGPESEDEDEIQEDDEQDALGNHAGPEQLEAPREGTPQFEVLPPVANAFISSLCSISLDALYDTINNATYTTSVHRLIGGLMGSDANTSTSASFTMPIPGNIGEAAQLALSCGNLEKDESRLHTEYYFNTMKLAAFAQK